MKKYTVEITETLTRLVSIEAENPDEAERLVREKYKSMKLFLMQMIFRTMRLVYMSRCFYFVTQKRGSHLFFISSYD